MNRYYLIGMKVRLVAWLEVSRTTACRIHLGSIVGAWPIEGHDFPANIPIHPNGIGMLPIGAGTHQDKYTQSALLILAISTIHIINIAFIKVSTRHKFTSMVSRRNFFYR